MAEHLLDDLHVRAAGDGKARCGVAELMGVQAGDPDGPSSRTELFAEGTHPQRLSAPERAEDELVGALVRHVTLELSDQEGWDRDLPALVGLGSPPDQAVALDRCHRLGDDSASSRQVEPPHAQGRQLAEPDTGIGEEQHSEAVGLIRAGVVGGVLARLGREAGGVGEVVDLVVGEVQMLVLGDPREVDAGGDVASEPPVVDGHVQDQAEDAVDLLDGRGRVFFRQRGDPGLYVGVGDVRELHPAPSGMDVRAQDAGIALVRGRLEVRLPRQPAVGPVTDRHLRQRRIDVRTGDLRTLDACEEPLGIDLASERLVALRAGRRPVVRSPAGLPVPDPLLDAGHLSPSRVPSVIIFRLESDEIALSCSARVSDPPAAGWSVR